MARLHNIVASPKQRNDALGQGHYGASRGGGQRQHKGEDLLAKAGETIYSPMDAKVFRFGKAYAEDPTYDLIVLVGTGEYSGLVFKILYATPTVAVGTYVKGGQSIGHAQAVSEKHGAGMKDHIHVEVYYRSDYSGENAREIERIAYRKNPATFIYPSQASPDLLAADVKKKGKSWSGIVLLFMLGLFVKLRK